jgi:hypothetical protein
MNDPKTVEEAVEALDDLFQKHGQIDSVPFEDSLIPTHRLFWDLLNRVLILEAQQEAIIRTLEEQ